MKKVLEKYPVFLLLLPTFVVTHLEKELHGLIKYEFVYVRIIIFFFIPLFFIGIWYLIFRKIGKASLMSLACLIPYYYTGDFKNWLSSIFGHSYLQSYIFLLALIFSSLILIFLILKQKKIKYNKLFLFLNLSLQLFILSDVVFIFSIGTKPKYTIEKTDDLLAKNCNSCIMPDIYFIIFDAYTSSKHLAEEFNYSNRTIEDFLKKKGFIIPENSQSNYNYTAFSIGSILNMSYLKNVDPLEKVTDREYLQALKLVYNNKLTAFLEKNNYKIYNHSLFEIKNHPTTIRSVDFWGVRELFDQYNLLFKVLHDVKFELPGWTQRYFDDDHFVNNPETRKHLTENVLNDLISTIDSKNEQPKFTYAHFLCPHPPYYFDSTGKKMTTSIPWGTGYIHQIAYSNSILKKIVNEIEKKKDRLSIMIIQGDHGITFKEPIDTAFCFDNFNAIYLPANKYYTYKDSVTSINTFNMILNTFFNQNLRQLPNKRHFIWQ